jgi:hypothetical protein
MVHVILWFMLMISTDWVNVVTKIGPLLVASKIGLEVNGEKTKYMFTSQEQHAGQFTT